MRKETKLEIKDRDNTLDIVIREMPATQQIRWASRALLLLSNGKLGGGVSDIQGVFGGEGGANLFALLSGVEYEDAEPLMAELLECCYRRVAGKDGRMVEQQINLATADGLIEDLRTLYKLELESFKLNFGFFIDGDR